MVEDLPPARRFVAMTTRHMESNGRFRVLVAQLGSRRHYAIPRILWSAGKLEALYTDLYVGKWPWRVLAARGVRRVLPRKARILLTRSIALPAEKVRAFQGLGLKYIWQSGRARATERWKVGLSAADEFNRLIVREGLGNAECVYGFRAACLHLFEHAAGNGLRRVLDQCGSPATVEDDIVGQEYSRWPGWEERPSRQRVKTFARRERAEWRLADTILCPSEFVRRGVETAGGPVEKCKVVPYGVSASRPVTRRKPPSRPIKVLFVGQVRLQKGIPYLLDAMRQLGPLEAVCRMLGSIKLSPEKLHGYLPPNVSVLGSVPQAEMDTHYAWADVLCHPSLCEGSAMVIYEALVHGLPVITTPNSGSIIGDRGDSRHVIVPIRSADAIADAVRAVAADWQPADESEEAAELASYESYSDRLVAALAGWISPARSPRHGEV